MMNMGGAPNAQPQGMPPVPMGGQVAAPMAPPPPPPPQPVDPQTLFTAQMTLMKPTWDDVIGLFRNDRLRSFSIDIETDSTIAADDIAEKASVSDFVQVIGTFVSTMLPAAQSNPELAPFAMEVLKYAARRYKAGRQMETIIDEMADKLLQKAANPPATPQDPKIVAAQMMAQAKIQQGQDQIQIQGMKTQADVQLKQQEAQATMALRGAQAQADNQLEVAKASTDAQIAAMKAIHQPPRPM